MPGGMNVCFPNASCYLSAGREEAGRRKVELDVGSDCCHSGSALTLGIPPSLLPHFHLRQRRSDFFLQALS